VKEFTMASNPICAVLNADQCTLFKATELGTKSALGKIVTPMQICAATFFIWRKMVFTRQSNYFTTTRSNKQSEHI
jgi:hypothetical protein